MKSVKRLGLFLLTGLLLLAIGCSKNVEQRMRDALTNLGKASSMDVKLTVNMTMSVTQDKMTLPIPMNVDINISYSKQPIAFKMNVSGQAMGQTLPISDVYGELADDGNLKMYTKESNKWKTTTVPKATFDALLMNSLQTPGADSLGMFKSIKVIDSETVNGIKTDVVECVLDDEKIWSTAMDQLQKQGGLNDAKTQAILEKLKDSFKGLKIQYYLEQGKANLVKIDCDLSNLGKSLTDILQDSLKEAMKGLEGGEGASNFSFGVSDLKIEVGFDHLNNIQPIVIPEEARTAGQL